MKVYLRNMYGQQTVRDLSLTTILRIHLYQFAHVPKNERCIVKILPKKYLTNSKG